MELYSRACNRVAQSVNLSLSRPTRESNPESNGFAGRHTTVVKWAEFGVTDRSRTG